MRAILIILFLSVSSLAFSQELNLDVTVVGPNITKTDAKIFTKLEQEIRELMNNSIWTDDEFEAEERIDGNIQLTVLTEPSPGNFTGELIVKSSRPIYNSTYSTTVVNYIDKNISFTYDGISPIAKTTDGYVDNLSSILSFYAYFIIGMDYDTFANSGGNPHFNNAQNIFNNLPTNLLTSDGWTNSGSRQQNRYWLLENINNPKLRPYREAMYEYHRLGLDAMYEDYNKARAIMLSAVTSIGSVNENYNNSILLKMFSDAKRTELVDVFKVAESGQKTRVKKVMVAIDPSQATAYREFR